MRLQSQHCSLADTSIYYVVVRSVRGLLRSPFAATSCHRCTAHWTHECRSGSSVRAVQASTASERSTRPRLCLGPQVPAGQEEQDRQAAAAVRVRAHVDDHGAGRRQGLHRHRARHGGGADRGAPAGAVHASFPVSEELAVCSRIASCFRIAPF